MSFVPSPAAAPGREGTHPFFCYRDPEVCRLSYTTWTGGSPEEEPEQHERAHADEGAHDDRVAIPARVDHPEERIQRGYLSYRGV